MSQAAYLLLVDEKQKKYNFLMVFLDFIHHDFLILLFFERRLAVAPAFKLFENQHVDY